MTHTATPWKAFGRRVRTVRTWFLICQTENAENAAFIVLACNVHDELLAACKAFVAVDDADKSRKPLLAAQGQAMDGHTKLANYESCVKRARAAIAKAEKGE